MSSRGGGFSLEPVNLLTRRRFLQYGGVLGSAALLAACGGDDEGGGDTGGGAAPTDLKVRIAYTAGTFPSIVNGKVGPLDYGSQFGLKIAEGDLLAFDSHATATQAVLSGNADVLAGSFSATLLLIQQGQDFKYFCPFSNGNDLLLVGTKQVDSVQKVTDKSTRIGIDSVGGLVNFVTNALLAAKGVTVNVETLNTQIIEDSPLRTAALVNGDIQAALVHQYDIPAIEKELGQSNVHVLARLWTDTTGLVFETFAARASWLNDNQEAAAALTKAMLTGNRELSRSYDVYKQAVTKYVEGGAPEETLKTIWELAREYEFWSWNGDLEQEKLDFTVQVAQQSGILKGEVDTSQVVDRRAMEAAIADIGEVTKEQILAG
jgi:ABC-type nitrate/sulfonate/bicarbonate transport system substrate-binding protein